MNHMQLSQPPSAAEPVSTAPSDRALVRAARSGDRSAREELIRGYWGTAQRAAFVAPLDRAASEDIAQEAMLAALVSLDRFDDSRPFGPWLYRIVVNRSRD